MAVAAPGDVYRDEVDNRRRTVIRVRSYPDGTVTYWMSAFPPSRTVGGKIISEVELTGPNWTRQ
jgi:hypothetical protein